MVTGGHVPTSDCHMQFSQISPDFSIFQEKMKFGFLTKGKTKFKKTVAPEEDKNFRGPIPCHRPAASATWRWLVLPDASARASLPRCRHCPAGTEEGLRAEAGRRGHALTG